MKQSLHSLSWKCLFVAATLCLSASAYSQEDEKNNTEVGITMGPMVFLGDLGGHSGVGTTFIKDWNWNTTKLAFGAYGAVYPAQWLGFRLSFTSSSIEGFDASIKPKGGEEINRLNRNLDFQSNITEGTLMAEVYPTVFLEDEPDDVFARIRPYGVIGVGVFHFHPYGSYRDPNTGETVWVSLPELHTEGEGFPEYPNSKPYKLTQLNIPMGFGVKFFLSESVNISFEIIHRKTFTDYIDDVHDRYIDPSLFYKYLSPQLAPLAVAMSNKAAGGYTNPNYKTNAIRGNPGNNDAYFTAQFKLGIRLGGGSAQRWRNSTHCPLLRF